MNLRTNLNSYEYEVLTKPEKVILAIRSEHAEPDLMEDLERIYNQLDQRDTVELTHVCLIGNENVISVKPDIITALMNKRSEDDNIFVNEYRSKLDREYETATFKDERDTIETLRFVVRVPFEYVSSDPAQIYNIFSKLTDEVKPDIFYIIGDNNFLRLTLRAVQEYMRGAAAMPAEVPKTILDVQPLATAPGDDFEPVRPEISIPPTVKKRPEDIFAEQYPEDARFPTTPTAGFMQSDKFDLQAELQAFVSDRQLRRSGEILEPKFDAKREPVVEPSISDTPELKPEEDELVVKPIEETREAEIIPEIPEPPKEVEIEETPKFDLAEEPEEIIKPKEPDFSMDFEPEEVSKPEAVEPEPEPEPILPEKEPFKLELPEEPEEITEPEESDFSVEFEPEEESEPKAAEPEPEPEPILPEKEPFKLELAEEPEEITKPEESDFSVEFEPEEESEPDATEPEPEPILPEKEPFKLELPEEPEEIIKPEESDFSVEFEPEEESEPKAAEPEPEPSIPEMESPPPIDIPEEPEEISKPEESVLLPDFEPDKISEPEDFVPEIKTPEEAPPPIDIPEEPKEISKPEDSDLLPDFEADEDSEGEEEPLSESLGTIDVKAELEKALEKLEAEKKSDTEPSESFDTISELKDIEAQLESTSMTQIDAAQPLEGESETEPEDLSTSEISEPEITEQDLKTMLPEPEVKPPEPTPPTLEEDREEPETTVPEPRHSGPINRIEVGLKSRDFNIVKDASIDDVDVIATSDTGKYKRIFIKFVDECTLDSISEMEKLVEFNFADAGLVIANDIPELITAFSLPEKVMVYSLEDFESECRIGRLLSS
ncbi:MAG: hypothetical protein JSV49_08370 [Thermoplasmata archaeon]|nr:MAG: hypothetical protein JSV49_08370 [Thermoplasmata archaeon]